MINGHPINGAPINGSAGGSAPEPVPVVAGRCYVWRLRLMVDGVDMSAQLTGGADVDREEGAAGVFGFDLFIAPGTPVLPLEWVGREVTLDIQLEVSEQESGFMRRIRDFMDPSENYNINVLRIPEGDFHRSSVGPGNVSHLDSEDNRAVPKGASMDQVGTAHEFGHMIGLPDEYHAGHAHESDTDSIMNSGMEVRERHLDLVEDWVENNS